MNSLKDDLFESLKSNSNVLADVGRENLVKEVVRNKEALISDCGSLATWTEVESTGRSPKDTYIVKGKDSFNKVDWNSKANNLIEKEVFDEIFKDAIKIIKQSPKIYETNRSLGADSKYALPVKLVSNSSVSALFTYNVFRDMPEDISKSVFFEDGFTILVLPKNKVDEDKYKDKIKSNIVVAMDFDRKIGLIYGSAYMGSIKKLLFTVMNYLLPEYGVLPLHCGSNISKEGESALFLGLSGTGKTTLSTDSARPLIGDDEHLWSDIGIANLENGCYAKLINLDKDKEPEIHKAVFSKRDYLESGCLIENAMMYPDGKFDLYDARFTQNSRASYPLKFLKNVDLSSKASHPKHIIFLTADANGVLPPVAKLNKYQAMLWFIMGYTSKLAGTETGIVNPVSTFSRFFGEPFMPRNPDDYANLLGEKMDKYNSKVYLVNTGWSGGPFGVGKRMDIKLTKRIIQAILNNELEDVAYESDELFHLSIPVTCPDIKKEILKPVNTWTDQKAYKKRAMDLANDFCDYFDLNYSSVAKEIEKECPGK